MVRFSKIRKKILLFLKLNLKNEIVKENGYDRCLTKIKNKIGEIKDIETLKTIYYLSDEDIENIKKGILTPPLPCPPSLSFFQQKNK